MSQIYNYVPRQVGHQRTMLSLFRLVRKDRHIAVSKWIQSLIAYFICDGIYVSGEAGHHHTLLVRSLYGSEPDIQ